jgi:hypothetical protein
LWTFPLGVLAIVGTLDAIWGPIWPTFREIHQTGSDAASPFTFPFAIKNRSVLFQTRITAWRCITGEFKIGTNRIHVLDAENGSGGAGVIIQPDDAANYRCSITIARGLPVTSFGLSVIASYKNVLWSGTAKHSFQWISADGNSQWIDGAALH